MNRILITFWALVAMAIGGVALMSFAIGAPASPTTGLELAAGGIVSVLGGGLALRILLALPLVEASKPDEKAGDVAWKLSSRGPSED